MDSGIDFDSSNIEGVSIDLTRPNSGYKKSVEPGACAEDVLCWNYGRVYVLDDPNIQNGVRAYFSKDETESRFSLNKNTCEVRGEFGITAGINLSSAQKPDGKTRDDVVKGSVGASVQASVDENKKVKSEIILQASAKILDINSEADLPEFCFKDNCYEATVGAEAAMGVGVEGGIGYEKYKTKPGGTFTANFGSGLGAFFKGNVRIDMKPNENNKEPKP